MVSAFSRSLFCRKERREGKGEKGKRLGRKKKLKRRGDCGEREEASERGKKKKRLFTFFLLSERSRSLALSLHLSDAFPSSAPGRHDLPSSLSSRWRRRIRWPLLPPARALPPLPASRFGAAARAARLVDAAVPSDAGGVHGLLAGGADAGVPVRVFFLLF